MPTPSQSPKAKRSRIPAKFYRGVHLVIAHTVGELKRALSELPDELPTSLNGQGLDVSVFNHRTPTEHLRVSRIA